MQAMLLAAGLGTRLRPLTETLPKPVVPMLNRALGSWALDTLKTVGVEHVVINTHVMPELLREHLQRDAPTGLRLTFSHEPELLGTAGGLKQACQYFADSDAPVIIANADILFCPDLARALRVHQANDAVATMILRDTPEPEHWGAIETDVTGRVRKMLDAPKHVRESTHAAMFSGVHILSPQALATLPNKGCVIRDGYQHWLSRGQRIDSIHDASPWSDLGTPQRYLEANLAALDHAWPHLHPELDATGSLVDPTAHISHSASIERCVIGAHATVDEGVNLKRCVVWPGTRVTENANDCVLTT